MAAELNISAFKRTPFVDDIADAVNDYTGATFSMHIRNRAGDTGTPLVTLANASAGSQGISVTYDPDYTYEEHGVIVESGASLVLIQIDEASLEALALSNPADSPLVLHYDIHVTPSGEPKRVAYYGQFIIMPGVTV